tara:strand:+ start:536 stop:1552 length:1017 start_codon:yes stop_codon:yes gene_type:complete
MFKNYYNCIFCNSKNLVKSKSQALKDNFYVDAIISDLKISKEKMKKIKTYECQKCLIKQNNPWFTPNISKKIYSIIYGQHNRNWENLINFMNKKRLPDHGDLYQILNDCLKIKKYAEYNSPFMGLFLNFFHEEYKKKTYFYKEIHKNMIKYFNSRQLAGKSKSYKFFAKSKSKKFKNLIQFLKDKNKNKKTIKKFLFIDNTSLGWGQNDNYKSTNSKSYAQELFDLELLEFDKKNEKLNFDLFGIFHSLDHTFEPNKIFNFALNSSKYVIVYCHNQQHGVSKQHLFSLTKNFLKYLSQNKIYNIDITNLINKSFHSPELYFICSRVKKNIKLIEKTLC